jgi:hypothetical protein
MYIGSLLAFFVLALGVTSAPAQQAKPAADTGVVALLRKHDDKGSLTRTCEWATGEAAQKEMAWGAAMWLFRSLHFSNLTGPVQPAPGK